MKPWLKNLLKVAGSCVILWLLASRIQWDPAEFKKILAGIHLSWFVLSLSGVLLVLGIKSYRWNLLLMQEGCKYSKFKGFVAYMASFTIGLVTPGRIGEIARLYYVREDTGISFYRSFKTLVTDRIFDFAFLIWFGVTGMLYFYKILGNLNGLIYLMISGLGMIIVWLAGFFLLKKLINPETASTGKRFILESWNGMFRLTMGWPWILTLLAYFIYYFANFLIFKSIGINLSVINIGFILSLMSLATLIPISLAGFGTREASLIYLLSFYAVEPEVAIIFSLLQFSAFFLWGGVIGLIFWIKKPVKMQMIKDDYFAFMCYLRGSKQ
ncbi:MAG: lysylphosphatidylglycerol synthase transmembrane domain-containing protein [Bacteroidota bacterium]